MVVVPAQLLFLYVTAMSWNAICCWPVLIQTVYAAEIPTVCLAELVPQGAFNMVSAAYWGFQAHRAAA